MVITIHKLVHIQLKILRANTVIRSVYGALELSPEALYGVGVNISHNIMTFAVLNSSPAVIADLRELGINSELICHNLCIL